MLFQKILLIITVMWLLLWLGSGYLITEDRKQMHQRQLMFKERLCEKLKS